MIKLFTKVIAVFVFLLTSNIALGQYKTIYFDSIPFYRYGNPSYMYSPTTGRLGLLGPTGDFIPVEIQSKELIDQDTVYTNSLVVKQNTSNRSDDCYAKISSAWAGKKIILTKDKRDIFINAENDSIIFRKDAGLNDSWTFYSKGNNHFTASVIRKAFEPISIYGSILIDSVMTVIINYKNNSDKSPADHIFNGKEWKISQKYGFVKTYDLLNFPNDTNALVLQGFNSKGVKNLTELDIYNFEIGDIFHTMDSSVRIYFSAKNTISTVIDKRITDNELVYKIENWFNNYQNDPRVPPDFRPPAEGKDTTEIIIKLNQSLPNLLNKLPTLRYPDYFNYHVYQFVDQKTSQLSKGTIGLNLIASEESPDSCYTQSYEPSIENVYMEGLGGPYYNGLDLAPMPTWKMRKLVYYKKGTIEWGTPLQIVSGINKNKINSIVSLYPNPSNDKIKIVSDGIQDSFYKIYNYEGREILSGYFTSNEEVISVKEIISGIYSVVILNENGAIYSSKFIKN
ncbi:T9SS type A sorting domain-containing protein [Sporocytophaga myxococcoides]|uniref:T9SS type A sorting domain-containing protein n=1 Tax=Sporocytophaga myxococcoides TaxID=153721 RepID=UPI00041C10EF|nr:T9SS type A sorting domain-containing protein [Sporocytophaga myxococcoides]